MMRASLVTVTPPAAEPIVLADAKLWLRLETGVTADDALITRLIVSAREWVERELEQRLITQTVRQTHDRWPGYRDRDSLPDEGRISDVRQSGVRWVELLGYPVQSITSVTVYADDDTPTVWDAANYRLASEQGGRMRLAPRSGSAWPSASRQTDGVEIVYVTGYGATGANVPDPIKQAMYMLIAHWYENREAGLIGTISKEIEFAVNDLLRPYRFYGL